jgi:hypothetical protein
MHSTSSSRYLGQHRNRPQISFISDMVGVSSGEAAQAVAQFQAVPQLVDAEPALIALRANERAATESSASIDRTICGRQTP